MFGANGRSKTADILFAVEVDRRHKANGVRATAVHGDHVADGVSWGVFPWIVRGRSLGRILFLPITVMIGTRISGFCLTWLGIHSGAK